MESENLNQAEPLVVILEDQLNIFIALILRPVVQRQIAAILVILIVVWLLPLGYQRWGRRRSATTEPVPENVSRWQRLKTTVYDLLTPILVLLLLNITIWLFGTQNYPNGLLQNLTNLAWLWLIYRLVLTLLYARFGEDFRPFRKWIVTPIFLFLAVLQIITTLPGSPAVIGASIGLGPILFPLGDLLLALITLYLFIVTAWIAELMMVRTLPSRFNSEPGVIESVATLVRYFFLATGVLVFLGILGLNITSLAIIAGGLSVGIGIGLQDIVSNFVSGLVLLFEQTLRSGDVIELDGRISTVEKISLRATTVRTRTNEELIIPNASFTTEKVKNFTKSDRLVQVIVPFGVSYQSDPELVRRLAVETGLQHALVLADPEPTVLFMGFADSSIDFNLLVSVNNPEMTLVIRSDLYFMLWKVFADNDIEIPFPQRDLNLGDGWEKLEQVRAG